jgi:hypothetical protein
VIRYLPDVNLVVASVMCIRIRDVWVNPESSASEASLVRSWVATADA